MEGNEGIMNPTTYRLKVTFTEDILGSTPLNEEVYSDYVASKHPNGNGAAELETVAESTERGKTGFHRNENGKPVLYDYVVKAYLKDTWTKCRLHKGSLSSKLTMGKSKITGQVFVSERRITILDTKEYVLERPLRAETAQGPRVALAASDTVRAGAHFTCTIEVLAPDIITEEILREWLDYGKYSGFGQWRSGGWGRFSYQLWKVEVPAHAKAA